MTDAGSIEPNALRPKQRIDAERKAFSEKARDVARFVAQDTVRFKVSGKLTSKAEWFHDGADKSLVVVVGPHEEPDCADEVLAYALAWQGPRRLDLVLPEAHKGLALTQSRLSRIGTPVRLFVYGQDLKPRPATALSFEEALAAAKTLPLRATQEHHLPRARARWVTALIQSADQHWALTPAHRSSYLAWHCLGRQVLRIARRGNGLCIEAGVAHTKPPPGEEPVEQLDIVAELTDVQRALIEERVATAVWKRFAGHDRGHVEHRLQAALAVTQLKSLDLWDYAREYPAWRGKDRPGYIDFLGIGRDDSLHVVETKVGTADVRGVVQTLDYATWVAAHASDIRADQGWPPAKGPVPEAVTLDFVFAPRLPGPAIGPYIAGQLNALAKDVPWRVSIVADPVAPVLDISEPLSRSTPPPGPLVSMPVDAIGSSAHP